MDASQVRKKLKEIEATLGGKISEDYKKFSSEVVQGNEVYELELVSEGQVYLYGCAELLERNATYEVQVYESDYLLIGQDGDLGYFLSLKGEDEVYSLDLGALGALSMNKEADSIYGL
ncbi:hypothetical protein [Pseudomonas sp. W2-17]|uniref:hypothetical protein n=1 Tax=Pseudomonas sp. W2-17 TaxID=3058039 RepID=UPI0034E0CC75